VVASKGRSQRTWKAIRYSNHDARRYAERQGLTLKGTEKIWNSRIANIAILWVRAHDPAGMAEFLHAVYPRFWERDLDIEDIAVVIGCLEEAGIDAIGFADFVAGEGGALHDSLQAQFHPSGIYGVPTYVLDGEVLHGREHIPYLRWRLTGANGPAPDIAYEIA
jgi:2-hydroxychromene-2-carboxylate isomerase